MTLVKKNQVKVGMYYDIHKLSEHFEKGIILFTQKGINNSLFVHYGILDSNIKTRKNHFCRIGYFNINNASKYLKYLSKEYYNFLNFYDHIKNGKDLYNFVFKHDIKRGLIECNIRKEVFVNGKVREEWVGIGKAIKSKNDLYYKVSIGEKKALSRALNQLFPNGDNKEKAKKIRKRFWTQYLKALKSKIKNDEVIKFYESF